MQQSRGRLMWPVPGGFGAVTAAEALAACSFSSPGIPRSTAEVGMGCRKEAEQPCISKPWTSLSACSGCSRPVQNLRFLWRWQIDDTLWPLLIIIIFLRCKQYMYFHILQNATDLVIWGWFFILLSPPQIIITEMTCLDLKRVCVSS